MLYTVGRKEERWARDLVCVMEDGRCGYMGGDSVIIYYVYVNIVRSVVSCYVFCRMICTYVIILYICNLQYHTK